MPVFHAIREYAADGSDVEAARHRGWVEGGKPVSRACASPRTLDEYEPLAPQPGDRVIAKPRFSAFFATQLDLVLRRLGVGTVVLIGTTTPNCIRTTCYDALSLDYNVVLLEDCTSSRTPEVQAANIEDMAFIGAHIMTCDEFCERGLANVADVAGGGAGGGVGRTGTCARHASRRQPDDRERGNAGRSAAGCVRAADRGAAAQQAGAGESAVHRRVGQGD